MKSALLLIALGALAVGCAGDGATPTSIAANLANPLKQDGLLQCSILPSSSVKQTIGPAGGTMQIGPHVFVVPAGALAAPVVIQAKTTGGTGNAVAFKPTGLLFLTPAYVTLSYANCNTGGSTASKEVAYTTDSLAIISYVPSSDRPSTRRVTAQVVHFSNYAVAWRGGGDHDAKPR
jgi:hypothetical protein